MTALSALAGFFAERPDHPGAADFRQLAATARPASLTAEQTAQASALYHDAIAALEPQLWLGHRSDGTLLGQYQALFRELETLLAKQTGHNSHHSFVIVIPIADRPQHLKACLGSLLDLCNAYGYGGLDEGRYSRLRVLVADDSQQDSSIEQHRQITEHYTALGIECRHFTPAEQRHMLETLGGEQRQAIIGIVEDLSTSGYAHKGASVTRNIALLKLDEWLKDDEGWLIWFLDSDQEFRVDEHPGIEGCQINYLYYLDRIFRKTDTLMLTGKVVGDPPVSPAVMAGNFLDDVSTFLQQLAGQNPATPCAFHGRAQQADDAAYHDMADLFGFQTERSPFSYTCRLQGHHDHMACLEDFAQRLNRFFDGEHPTRQTVFDYGEGFERLSPARTVYTGNYVFRREGLRHFIPFAPLKLRMAGPTLGRLIRAQLGDRFVSANLPMLHRRTVQETGRSECRPGIEHNEGHIDLSAEFERQFFGDVMLFGIEALTEMGYPDKPLTAATIRSTIEKTYESIKQRYRQKQQLIMQRLSGLRSLYEGDGQWWHKTPGADPAKQQLERFMANIEHNFEAGARPYQLINSDAHCTQRLDQICEAITRYPADRSAWADILSHGTANA